MPLYESTFIIRQDLSRQDVDKLMDSYADIIKKEGGKIVKNEYWGLRNLAYKVKKYKRAHYNMLAVDGPCAPVKEVERLAGLSEEVLRNITVRVDEIEKEPSAIIRNDREEETQEEI